MKNILITGGCGYIGSHIATLLLEKDYNVIIYDNLINSSKIVIDRIKEITGVAPKFYEKDILDKNELKKCLKDEKIDLIIHCAALKAVGESVKKPLLYYQNNITGTLSLLEAMSEVGVKNIIFSSSATVYGDSKIQPIKEDFPKMKAENPYGASKSMMEDIMIDLNKADKDFKVIILRYFNPIGAHKSGLIGEDPRGIPNNLVPYIAKVAAGKLDHLSVYGNDYDTKDGTGLRDYIHVMDLAKGHILALEKIDELKSVEIINLGTGRPYSVLEVVDAYEKASNQKIKYEISKRREGDVAKAYADPSYANEILGFTCEYDIYDMCKDSYNFQQKNPNGYEIKE